MAYVKPKTSEAKRRANDKYNDKFERVNCRFNKGTKERIKALGCSINSYVRQAVTERLEREEKILAENKGGSYGNK